jgi:hypothetical protein
MAQQPTPGNNGNELDYASQGLGSGTLDPFSNPGAWDVIVIAGQQAPGILLMPGGIEFKRGFAWDQKKGKGTLGATITFVGQPLAKGHIKLVFWTAAHFVAWSQFVPLLKYDPTKITPQAVDIYHPSLADVNITSVVIEEIGIPEPQIDKRYIVELHFIEYQPPPAISAVDTPTTSAVFTNTGQPVTGQNNAQNTQENQIAQLLAQASQP